MSNTLRLGTRGSKLALAQTHTLQRELLRVDPTLDVQIVTIKTSGDLGNRDRLGAFVREIQEALLRDEVDLALHCLKDLPTEHVAGLMLAAHLQRGDRRDSFISRHASIEALPAGAIVGTGSVRRSAQMARLRPDLNFKPLVGNVDTRLRKLSEGEYDAIILAMAGLQRIGLQDSWASSPFAELQVTPLAADAMLPAAGQAVLVLESREHDERAKRIAAALNHPATEAEADAERTFLSRFGGGCSLPVAVSCEAGANLSLKGIVLSPDGREALTTSRTGEDPKRLGTAAAEELIERGALDLLQPAMASSGGIGL